ncbi:MAG: hypothetical protein NTW26_08915 [bacterium]|nr:hypothetical protein [bacterium]
MKKIVLLLVLVFAAAFAGQYDLLICHCDPGSTSDVETYIAGDPDYGIVTLLDCTTTTPSVGTMLDYGCVLTWSNYTYDNPTSMGDNLADYMDLGGGVVSCCFAHYSSDGLGLGGLYASGAAYCPLTRGNNDFSYNHMGTHDHNHPVMEGVSLITSIYYWQSISTESGATWLADLAIGSSDLAAINADENAVAVNLYPGDVHHWSGDGWVLLNNAIMYMMENSNVAIVDTTWGAIKASF